jgi:hypothetical protein
VGSRYEIHLSAGGGGSGPPPPGSVDHFAPKYLIGNIPNGDDAVPYNTAGFMYIPDPGDGMGIALALTQPNGPGDLWLRPGLYDLGAGSTAAPLVIPPGIVVKGSGPTTVVRSKASGDQGVFRIDGSLPTGKFSTLRDMRVESVAEVSGGVSTALIRCTDPATIEDVEVILVASAEGSLRDAIQFESSTGSPLPPSRLSNVRIALTRPAQASPVRALVGLPNAVVFGEQVEIFDGSGAANGFDVGIDATSASFIIQSFLAFGFSDAAVRSVGGGSIRVDEAYTISSPSAAPTAIGFDLSGGGHVLRSILMVTQGVLAATGIKLSGGGVNAVEIDDVQIYGFAACIDAGGGGSDANDVSIVNSTLNAPSIGIRIAGGGSSACHIKGNTIQIFTDPGAPQIAGIHLAAGNGQHVEGNFVNVQGDPQVLAPGVYGIWVQAQLSTIANNNVIANYVGYGIEVDAERVVTNGNVVQCAEGPGCIHVAPPGISGPRVRCVTNNNSCTFNTALVPGPLPAAIVYEGQSGTINGNAIFMGTPVPPAAGIVLTAVSAGSVCNGNVSDGSFGLPVVNLGAGNDVAHNIGN